MKRKNNVIPLFPDPKPVPNEPFLEVSEEEIEEVARLVEETVNELNPPVHETACEEPEREEDIEPIESIEEWLADNCNGLPVYVQEDGEVVVGMPTEVYTELLRIVVDSVNDGDVMRTALEKIANRPNELGSHIAQKALANLTEAIDEFEE